MDWRTRIRQELDKDAVKEIHEDRGLSGSGSGFSYKFSLRVETRSGMVFSTSETCWFEKVKDVPQKEMALMDKAYEAAIAALE